MGVVSGLHIVRARVTVRVRGIVLGVGVVEQATTAYKGLCSLGDSQYSGKTFVFPINFDLSIHFVCPSFRHAESLER